MYFHLHTNWHIRTKRHAQIEEGAYAQAKGDRLWTRDFCSISLLNLLILTGGNMLVSTFPFYLSELGATKVIIGLVASIYYATSLIMRPIAGWWLDHRSRKSIFLAASALWRHFRCFILCCQFCHWLFCCGRSMVLPGRQQVPPVRQMLVMSCRRVALARGWACLA